LPTGDALLSSILTHGIDPINENPSITTAAFAGLEAGNSRVACGHTYSQRTGPVTEPAETVHVFEDDKYTLRLFCTNLAGKAHEVIAGLVFIAVSVQNTGIKLKAFFLMCLYR